MTPLVLLPSCFIASRAHTPVVRASSSQTNSTPIYKDPSYSTDERVSNLLGQMTIQEKVSQM